MHAAQIRKFFSASANLEPVIRVRFRRKPVDLLSLARWTEMITTEMHTSFGGFVRHRYRTRKNDNRQNLQRNSFPANDLRSGRATLARQTVRTCVRTDVDNKLATHSLAMVYVPGQTMPRRKPLGSYTLRGLESYGAPDECEIVSFPPVQSKTLSDMPERTDVR